jgi:hypothetical protein
LIFQRHPGIQICANLAHYCNDGIPRSCAVCIPANNCVTRAISILHDSRAVSRNCFFGAMSSSWYSPAAYNSASRSICAGSVFGSTSVKNVPNFFMIESEPVETHSGSGSYGLLAVGSEFTEIWVSNQGARFVWNTERARYHHMDRVDVVDYVGLPVQLA